MIEIKKGKMLSLIVEEGFINMWKVYINGELHQGFIHKANAYWCMNIFTGAWEEM